MSRSQAIARAKVLANSDGIVRVVVRQEDNRSRFSVLHEATYFNSTIAERDCVYNTSEGAYEAA